MQSSHLVVMHRVAGQIESEMSAGTAPRTGTHLIRDRLGARLVSSSDASLAFLGARIRTDDSAAAALAAWQDARDVSDVFVSREDIAIRFLPLAGMGGWKGRLHGVVHSCNSLRRKVILRALGETRVGNYITICEAQRRALIEGAGIDRAKVHFVRAGIDTAFFSADKAGPVEGEPYIFACGRENRDYATLATAARMIPWPVRVQATSWLDRPGEPMGRVPPNMFAIEGRITFRALRDLYAAARFVVVPLHAADHAAGASGLLEAMSMGKAVIVTASPGLADYTLAKSLVTVPAGDASALAREMTRLWRDPPACEARGRENQAWAREHADVQTYASEVSDLVRRS